MDKVFVALSEQRKINSQLENELGELKHSLDYAKELSEIPLDQLYVVLNVTESGFLLQKV